MQLMLAATDLGRFLGALGLMILVLMVAAVVLLWFRSRLLGRGGVDSEVQGGLLQNLRSMRDRGEITTEEYDRARRAMAVRAAAQRDGESADGGTSPRPAAAVRAPDRPGGSATTGAEGGPGGAGEVRAKPGFDLTGQPLPKSSGAAGPPGPAPRSRPPDGPSQPPRTSH